MGYRGRIGKVKFWGIGVGLVGSESRQRGGLSVPIDPEVQSSVPHGGTRFLNSGLEV